MQSALSHPCWTASTDAKTSATVGFSCFCVYLATLCPTVYWYDSAEFAAAAVLLGIPHPPGYPLYVLIGHVFSYLPGDPAFAVNLMSAAFGALAVGFCYLLARRLGAKRVSAIVSALVLGTTRLVWDNAVVAEVYTPGLAAVLATWLLLLSGSRRGVVLAAGVAGLSLGLHLFVATCGLGFAVLVLGHGLAITTPSELRKLVSSQMIVARARLALACLASAALGACVFLWLPVRAAMDPSMNFGDPSSWERFWWVVTGGNYKTWFATPSDTGERALLLLSLPARALTSAGALLTIVGLVSLFTRAPLLASALALGALGNVWFFFDYRVHDVEVFFIPAIAIATCLLGVGLQALYELVRGHQHPHLARALSMLAFGLPGILVLRNASWVDRSEYTEARDYGQTMCDHLPANAKLLHFTTPSEWRMHSVFGEYFQKVIGCRPDVEVITMPTALDTLARMRANETLFLYEPVAEVVELFDIVPDGPAFRILRVRPERLPAPLLPNGARPQ